MEVFEHTDSEVSPCRKALVGVRQVLEAANPLETAIKIAHGITVNGSGDTSNPPLKGSSHRCDLDEPIRELTRETGGTSTLAPEVEALAAVAGAAIRIDEQHRLVQRLESANSALLDAAHLLRDMNTYTTEELLGRIISLSVQAVPAARAGLYIVDHAKRELYCVAHTTPSLVQHFHMAFGRGVPGLVAISKAPARYADLREADPLFASSLTKAVGTPTGPGLGVPVVFHSSRLLVAVIVLVRLDICSTDTQLTAIIH